MTRESDLIGLLEGYLDDFEGHTPLPDAAREAIRARLPSTPQRPAWWPGWRFLDMNSVMKIGLAVAAVAIAAILGFNYLANANVGGPGLGDPTPTPIPTATAVADTGGLRPHVIGSPFPVRITLQVPDGWRSWVATADAHGLVVDNALGESTSGWGPAFWIVQNVYADPCDISSRLDPQLGPTVDDLVEALASLPGYEASTPTPVTVSGFEGVEFQLTAPEYGDDCPDHRTWSTFTERRSMFPGETNRIQVLDVDGVRLLVSLVEYAHTTEYEQELGIPFDPNGHVADQPELRAMLDSMRIESRP